MSLPFIALRVAKKVYNKTAKKDAEAGVTIGAKAPMTSVKKFRLWMILPAVLGGILVLLSWLAIFAGKTPSTLPDMQIFTLNVSRIGAELHQDINKAINGINFDDLHVDVVKRSVPAAAVATVTSAPTTMITMAPRSPGLDDVLSSATDAVGDGLSSAKSDTGAHVSSVESAVTSKASSVKSKASSAANAAESSINAGIDKAEDKIKNAFKNVGNDIFVALVEKLDLAGSYSFYVSNTCEGHYADADGHNITVSSATVPSKGVKLVEDSCHTHSKLNLIGLPLTIIYWLVAIPLIVAFGGLLVAIAMPKEIVFTVVIIADAVAMGFAFLGSAMVHAVGFGLEHLVNFVGEGLSIEGKLGTKFVGLSWAITCLLLAHIGIMFFLRRHIKKHQLGAVQKLPSVDYGREYEMGHPISAPAPAYNNAPIGQPGNRTYENPGTPPPVPQQQPYVHNGGMI